MNPTSIGVTPAPLTAVVCCYTTDRRRLLDDAVASLRAQTVPPERIVVVVDHNPALLTTLNGRWPGVTVVANDGPRGLSGARNTGWRAAGSPVVAFVDDDAQLSADWVEGAMRHLADPAVLAVGGTIAPAWQTARPGWFPREFDWIVGCTYTGLPRQAARVRNLIGAAMAVRTDVLAAVGGFNADLGRVGTLPVGCEETELCIRATTARPEGRIVYDPALGARHAVPDSRCTLRYFTSRCYHEGVSKAVMTRVVGRTQGLESERAYVRRTLPVAVASGVVAGVGGRDVWGLPRAGAVLLGLACAAAGYGRATLNGGRA